MCGQDVVHYFLFHLAIANADWSFPNLMFFSSLPEKRESFPRFSPPPPFISHRSNHAKDSTVFLIFSISFIFPFSESLDLKEEKKIVAKSFPSFFFSKFFLTHISNSNWYFFDRTDSTAIDSLYNYVTYKNDDFLERFERRKILFIFVLFIFRSTQSSKLLE